MNELTSVIRGLRKNGGATAAIVVTLGLGLGAAMAMFSVVHAVLLQPLPYEEPERLVHVWQDLRARNVTDFAWPAPDFHDLRTEARAFDGLAALTTRRQIVVNVDGDPEQIQTGVATPNLFRLLGVKVFIGRDFRDDEGLPRAAAPGATPDRSAPLAPAILSHAAWRRRFGGNRAVAGSVVAIGDSRFEVIGVLEPGFELLFPPGLNVERRPEIWTPLQIDFAAGSRLDAVLRVIGRVRRGVSTEELRRDLDSVAAGLRSRFAINQTAGLELRAEPMHEDLVREARPSVLAVMGAVVVLLAIACANVSNLVLIRTSDRLRELAVRSALGSTRWRLMRPVLAECALLSGTGAALGLVLASMVLRVLPAIAPHQLPRLESVSINPAVGTFAALLAAVCALLAGIAPAIRFSRPDIIILLRPSGRGGSLGRQGRLADVVVIVEVGLAVVLLVASGLMIRSFIALQRAAPGYDPEGVTTFFVANVRMLEASARETFMRELRSGLAALPGVQGVTAAAPLPLDGRPGLARWGTEEALADASRFRQATAHTVLPGYFEVMGTKLLEGRTFTEADNRPEARVLIVDRVLAAKAFGGRPAVGRTLLARLRTDEPERFEIVGVVEHQRHTTLARDGREGLFVTDGYMQHGRANRWAVRTDADASTIARAARECIRALDPRAALIEVQPMSALVDRAQEQTRFALLLLVAFAAIALVLAAVGLFSMLSTVVRRRTPEIGMRVVLGAARHSIFLMMVGAGLRLAGIGLVSGAAAALAVAGALRALLVGVEPTDRLTFVATAAGVMVVAIVAAGLPAWRAARLAPLLAIKRAE